MRKISAAGLAHLKQWEGYRSEAYQDSGGVWTIGFGSTRWPDGRPVAEGDTVTEAEAETLIFEGAGGLSDALAALAEGIRPEVLARLSDNQFAALASWVYNVGISAFRASTLRARLNAGLLDEVPAELRSWVYAGGRVVAGLENRRAAEAALWLTPDAPADAAPPLPPGPKPPAPSHDDALDPTLAPRLRDMGRLLIDIAADLDGGATRKDHA